MMQYDTKSFTKGFLKLLKILKKEGIETVTAKVGDKTVTVTMKNNLTHEQLAAFFDISPSVLWKIKSKKYQMTEAMQHQIAFRLGLSWRAIAEL